MLGIAGDHTHLHATFVPFRLTAYQVPKAVLFQRGDKRADIGADEKFKFTVP